MVTLLFRVQCEVALEVTFKQLKFKSTRQSWLWQAERLFIINDLTAGEFYLILHFLILNKGRAAQVFRAALQSCLRAGGSMTNQKQLESLLPLFEHLALVRLCADTAMMNQTVRKPLWEESLVTYSWCSSSRKDTRISGTTPATAWYHVNLITTWRTISTADNSG